MAHPAITSRDQQLILICQEGFQSSLAAATLQRLGLAHATDLDGGFDAWAAAGLPLTPGRCEQQSSNSSRRQRPAPSHG
jgi:rhodanese-related sulfurtransferase